MYPLNKLADYKMRPVVYELVSMLALHLPEGTFWQFATDSTWPFVEDFPIKPRDFP